MPAFGNIRDFFKPIAAVQSNEYDGDTIVVAVSRSSTPQAPARDLRPSPRKGNRKVSRGPPTPAKSLSPASSVTSSIDAVTGAADIASQDATLHTTSSARQSPVLRSEPDVPATTSFTSISTLTTLPPSSQSSSRRIVRHGVPLVTNSSSDLDSIDEGSESDSLGDIDDLIAQRRGNMSPPAPKTPASNSKADSRGGRRLRSAMQSIQELQRDTSSPISDFEESANSDSLDDIDDLIARKKQKLAHTTHHTPQRGDVATTADGRSLRSATRMIEKGTPRRQSSPEPKAYKYSLASLIEQKEKDAALDARISEVEALVQRTYTPTQSVGQEKHGRQRLDQSVAAAVDEDEEDGQRLKQALRRMDALEEEVHFSFFGPVADKIRHPLPVSSLPDSGWTGLLGETESRAACFTSGFATDMVRKSALPDELLEWVLGELLLESNEELCHAYVGLLEASALARRSGNVLDLPMLIDWMARLGVRDDILGRGSCTAESGGGHEYDLARSLPSGLRWFLELLTRLSSVLPAEVRQICLSHLPLMLLDDNVQGTAATVKLIQGTLVDLLQSTSEEDVSSTIRSTAASLIERVNHPVLISRLLGSLPSLTGRTHSLKRSLALSAFVSTHQSDAQPFSSPSTWQTVIQHLTTSPAFKINAKTDFALLGARINTLDVAIGAGFADHAFLARTSAPVSADTARPAASAAETAFNRSVDELVAALRLLASNIRDAGAAHMRRTECKGAIDRLAFRLEFAVRTRPKPKQAVFGRDRAEAAAGSGFLAKFLKKQAGGEGVEGVRVVDEGVRGS